MSASQTLLEMTQEILESMQSDEVTSITDTAESKAVAHIIRRTYWDMFSLLHLPEHNTLFKLTATSASTPNLMTIPTNVMKLLWVKYNWETTDRPDDRLQPVRFLKPEVYLERTDKLIESADNVDSYSYTFNPLGTDTVKVTYSNDRFPRCYTSPDDFNLLFDAVNTDEEVYLHAERTQAYGIVDPTFTFSDGFTPDLDVAQFALLINEAKAQAFAEIKQTQNAKADQRSRQLKVTGQITKQRTPDYNPLDQFPNYGRKR